MCIYIFDEFKALSATQELRDISSMAMEFFDEKIVPSLKVTTDTTYNVNSVTTLIRLKGHDRLKAFASKQSVFFPQSTFNYYCQRYFCFKMYLGHIIFR